MDAKFENFLVIVATSGTSGLFNNLATQALELNELISQRSKETQEKPSETMIYETEDANSGKEPYHVEIVHIDKGDGTNKLSEKSQTPEEKIKSENSEKILEESPSSEVSTDDKKGTKRARSLWKENKKSGGRRNSHVKNLDQSDDLPVKEEISKAARPGISLKKQLSKKEEENASSVSEERNELGNNYQELVLLGGGIENCGPGRYRDKLGVCQDDKNFN